MTEDIKVDNEVTKKTGMLEEELETMLRAGYENLLEQNKEREARGKLADLNYVNFGPLSQAEFEKLDVRKLEGINTSFLRCENGDILLSVFFLSAAQQMETNNLLRRLIALLEGTKSPQKEGV